MIRTLKRATQQAMTKVQKLVTKISPEAILLQTDYQFFKRYLSTLKIHYQICFSDEGFFLYNQLFSGIY